jgi:phosphoribosylglycinamide formyltransferase-1
VPVNLLAALDGERFGAAALARAHDEAAKAGCVLRRVDESDDRLAAWIDFHFAPSWWSYEVGAGSAWVAERDGVIAGFAGFNARGLRFRWLRAWRERADVGIFGPYGVGEMHRKRGIGEALLTAALCGLREAGYARALIPAVDGERLIAAYVRRTGATIIDRYDLDTPRRFRATILASGAGSNARNVLERARERTDRRAIPLDVAAVVSNDPAAGALDAAREHGVPAITVAWDRARQSRAEYDARVIDAVASTEPELVLLLGWMHVLPAAFVRRFPETLNLHPSFLPFDPAVDEVVAPDGTVIPALRGAHALRDALRAGVPWTGATVHYVTEVADRGQVMVRVPVVVGDARTVEELRELVRPVEFVTVASAVRRWAFEREER